MTTSERVDTVQVVINGDSRAVPTGIRLVQWLESAGRDPRTVAVELNGNIVPRDRFPETVLVDGDRLEVVQFVQGG